MSQSEGSRWARGGVSGFMHFWWLDSNSNAKVDTSELFWMDNNYALYPTFNAAGNFQGDLATGDDLGFYGGYNPANPRATTDPFELIDPDAGSSRTREVVFTVERELMPDFGISLSGTYRIYDKLSWRGARDDSNPALWYYPETGEIENPDWYTVAGQIPATVGGFSTKDAAGRNWYVLKPEYTYTPWRMVMPRDGYKRTYFGVDFSFNKRLSNKWMLNGSISYQKQLAYYGDKALNNPTNKWAWDGETYNTTMNTSFMFKLGGLYQGPYGINFGFNYRARQGWPVRETFDIVDYNLPNPYQRSGNTFAQGNKSEQVYITAIGAERLDFFHDLSLRVEKMVTLGESGRLYFMADVFNALNSQIIARRYDARHGLYDVSTGLWTPRANDNDVQEILSPRILRLGVRFVW
jgi:hypothetical protein